MAKKGPALYELIQQQAQRNRPTSVVTRPASPIKPQSKPTAPPAATAPPPKPAPRASEPPPPPPPVPTPLASNEHAESWLAPSKTYRVPGGYILIAGVAVVAIAVGAYSLGFNVSQQQKEEADAQQHRDQLSNINDPTLNTGSGQVSGTRTISPPQSTPTRDPGSVPPTRSNAGANRPIDLSAASEPAQRRPTGGSTGRITGYKQGPNDPDPRTAELNYFILASFLQPEEADKAVDFFAANGVAAARLKPNNRGLCTLVALEGFPSGETRSETALEYKANLLRLGRDYRRNHGGGTDFSDLYLKKHQP